MSRGTVRWISPSGYGFVTLGVGEDTIEVYAPASLLHGLSAGDEIEVLSLVGGDHGLVASELLAAGDEIKPRPSGSAPRPT